MEVSGKKRDERRYEVCEPCSIDGTSRRADGYCEKCGEYICSSCFRDHLKSRLSRDHILGSLSQGQLQDKTEQGMEPCQKHTNEKLKYYCRHHDRVACGDCIVAEHKGCDMEFITHVARNFETSSEFKNMLENIGRLQEECTENRTKQGRNRTDNNGMTEAALKEIQTFRIKLNDYLDHAETEMINEARRMSKENDNLIAELEAKLNKVKLDFDDLKSKLDTKLYKQDKLFIHYLECKSRVSEVEISIDEVTRNSQIKQFFFQPNHQLGDLMVSKINMGTLKLTEKKLVNGSHNDVLTRQDIDHATGAAKVGVTQLGQGKTTPGTTPPLQQYRDPDPRAKGFDVGKRVRGVTYLTGRTGTVTSVDPHGCVGVRWDDGSSHPAVYAGFFGFFWLELI